MVHVIGLPQRVPCTRCGSADVLPMLSLDAYYICIKQRLIFIHVQASSPYALMGHERELNLEGRHLGSKCSLREESLPYLPTFFSFSGNDTMLHSFAK